MSAKMRVTTRDRSFGGLQFAAAALTSLLLGLLVSGLSRAQEISAHDIAKQLQNPIADSISLPFANESNLGSGPYRQTDNIMNIQPVIPIEIDSDWNLITRTTVPLVSQVRMSPTEGRAFGLGDITPILALSPAQPGSVIWGAGPTFSFPTATQKNLGSGQWAAGPAAVVLVMPDPWVFGLLMTHLWSMSDPGHSERMNRTAVQYFATYNFSSGWFISANPIIVADWSARSRDRWLVPFGADVGKVFSLGNQPMSVSAGYYYNAVQPDFGPRSQVRANFTLLF